MSKATTVTSMEIKQTEEGPHFSFDGNSDTGVLIMSYDSSLKAKWSWTCVWRGRAIFQFKWMGFK